MTTKVIYVVVTIGNTLQSARDCAELHGEKDRTRNFTIWPVQVTIDQMYRRLMVASFSDDQMWDIVRTYLDRHLPRNFSPDETYFRIHEDGSWKLSTPEEMELFLRRLGWVKL
jgi:hypothetical protein